MNLDLTPNEARMVMNYLDAMPGTEAHDALANEASDRGDHPDELEIALCKVVTACRTKWEESLP